MAVTEVAGGVVVAMIRPSLPTVSHPVSLPVRVAVTVPVAVVAQNNQAAIPPVTVLAVVEDQAEDRMEVRAAAQAKRAAVAASMSAANTRAPSSTPKRVSGTAKREICNLTAGAAIAVAVTAANLRASLPRAARAPRAVHSVPAALPHPGPPVAATGA